VRGHTVAADDVFEIVAAERRAALRAALVVIVPIFALPVVFLVLRDQAVDLPPIVPWLILGPVTLASLVSVAVVHDWRVTKRERLRSATYADRHA
jgi:hypothetical protein